MAYIKRNLTDGVTVINKDLLDHMQNGIYEAHDQLSTAVYAVLTAAAMDEIIANATSASVGSFYMYLGETTASYKKGSVYKIGEV